MASRYKFTEEQMKELEGAAKANKRKTVDRRLRALLMLGSVHIRENMIK